MTTRPALLCGLHAENLHALVAKIGDDFELATERLDVLA